MILFLQIILVFAMIGAIAAPIIIDNVRRIQAAEKSYYGSKNDTSWTPVKKRNFVAAFMLALILFVVSCSFIIIPTGYTGVRTTFGQIDSRPVPNGFNFKLPFVQHIEQVNNKQQDIVFKDKVWSETSERTAIYYENVTVTYQINPEKSAWIYANVANYNEALVNQSIVASAIKSSSKELSDVDATNRSIIEPLTMENLQKSLDEKYGTGVVFVNKVIISNADFDDGYNQAIAARQQAQLEAEQQEIENRRAIDKAEADAIVRQTTAEADAQARLTAAQAEAEANALLEKSLTDQILQEMWLEKWNGQLPQFVSDGGNSIMFGLDAGN